MIIKNEIKEEKKVLIFDIDDTLVYYDTLKDLVYESLNYYGIPQDDNKFEMQVLGVIKALKVAELSKDFSEELLYNCWEESMTFLNEYNITGRKIGQKMLNLETKYVKGMPNVKENLEELKQLKYHLICSTNWLEGPQRKKLMEVGIAEFFSKIYSCENNFAKPNPRHFVEIIKKERVCVEKVVMIGDSKTDLSSKRIGIDCVLIDPLHKKESLYDEATAVITNIGDIKKILKR